MATTVSVPVPDVPAIREAAAPYAPVSLVSLVLGLAYLTLKIDKKRPTIKTAVGRKLTSPPAAWGYLTGLTAVWCAVAEWIRSEEVTQVTKGEGAALIVGGLGTLALGGWAANRLFHEMTTRIYGQPQNGEEPVISTPTQPAAVSQPAKSQPMQSVAVSRGVRISEYDIEQAVRVIEISVGDKEHVIRLDTIKHNNAGDMVAIRFRITESPTINRCRLIRFAAALGRPLVLAERGREDYTSELWLNQEQIDRMKRLSASEVRAMVDGNNTTWPTPYFIG